VSDIADVRQLMWIGGLFRWPVVISRLSIIKVFLKGLANNLIFVLGILVFFPEVTNTGINLLDINAWHQSNIEVFLFDIHNLSQILVIKSPLDSNVIIFTNCTDYLLTLFKQLLIVLVLKL
jgi:hypothetical protein